MAGVVVALIGLAGAIAALVSWGQVGFGALEPGRTVRLVIASSAAMVLGAQLVFSSFFLGLLEQTRTAR